MEWSGLHGSHTLFLSNERKTIYILTPDNGSKGPVPASATMSSSEESTLFEVDELVANGLDVYDRFSRTQKNFIAFAVSIACLLSGVCMYSLELPDRLILSTQRS
jgi:hypothetical protein